MRLATLRTGTGTRAAMIDRDRALVLTAPDVGAFLQAGPLRPPREDEIARELDLTDLEFAPPLPQPAKVVCVGMNYRAHIEEVGAAVPEFPMLFAKFASTLIGPHDDLVLPAVSTAVDWEAELGVVIGHQVHRVAPAEALDAIAGYVVTNDVSMRDWQFRSSDVLQGKAFDRSTPVGPVLVTPDEIDHARDLEVRCEIDGQVMQRARTSDLVFSPAELISYISQFAGLGPGDLVLTGTPAGVGFGRDPKVYLSEGQVLRTSVEGIGELVNRCRAEVPAEERCPA